MTQPEHEFWVFLRNQKQWEDTHVAERFGTEVVLLPWQHCLELLKAGINAVQKILNFLPKKTKLQSIVRHCWQARPSLAPQGRLPTIHNSQMDETTFLYHLSLQLFEVQEQGRLPEQQAQLQLPGQKAGPPSIPISSLLLVSGECSQIPACTPISV